jgi:hypothetical protein
MVDVKALISDKVSIVLMTMEGGEETFLTVREAEKLADDLRLAASKADFAMQKRRL